MENISRTMHMDKKRRGYKFEGLSRTSTPVPAVGTGEGDAVKYEES